MESLVEAFVWSDKLATGIVEVDMQHRHLVEMVNQIGNLCTGGAASDQLKPVLGELVNYAEYHFCTEERLMRQHQVSAEHQESHIKTHDAFRKQMQLSLTIIENSPQDFMGLLAQLLEYLTRWLLEHIMVVDLRMAREIQALQAGKSHEAAVGEASAIVSRSGDVLIEALNTLYGRIGEKTVEVLQTNQALAKEREALRELNEKLELRVQQRTADLKNVNELLLQNNHELKRVNQQLENTQSQLLQSEKMASIGQLAAGVAHEINNPVGFVNSNLGTLANYVADMSRVLAAYAQFEDRLGEPDVARLSELKQEVDLPYLLGDIPKLLEESQDGLARVKRIIQDLRDFSHVDGTDWQAVNLERCMDSTLNVAWNEIKYKAEVVKKYAGIPEVECMSSQIAQVFMNLLVNAAQSIEKHGLITISTGLEGDGVWVEVSDTGCGIAKPDAQKIFDPFFTTKPVGKGTGLGLSVSYGIVQKHGGRIEVDSEPGRGTAMRVWLPRVRPGLILE